MCSEPPALRISPRHLRTNKVGEFIHLLVNSENLEFLFLHGVKKCFADNDNYESGKGGCGPISTIGRRGVGDPGL